MEVAAGLEDDDASQHQPQRPSRGCFFQAAAKMPADDGYEAKAFQEMMVVMSRKPCEANNVPEPEPTLPSEPASAAPAFDEDDANPSQEMMVVRSRKLQV